MVVLSEPAIDHFIKTCKPCSHFFNGIPTVDIANPDAKSSIVKACEEYGFFKVVNHGIPLHVMDTLEEETVNFFKLPQFVKEKAGNPSPFGYGNKKIGPNGDVGWVEYLLVSASPEFVSRICCSLFPDNPHLFSSAINKYISKVKTMGGKVLELMAEGLGIEDKNVLSKLIEDEKSDSYFRLNHYPACPELELELAALSGRNLVGFGEHTDPQIISLLRSNNTAGLQIALADGTWVSVPPDNNSFFVFVGDSLQVITNGKFKSVKHRVFADYMKSRISMIFFGGPPLSEKIAPLPCILKEGEDWLYKEFTWGEYKQAAYKSRLSDNRLRYFANTNSNNNISKNTNDYNNSM